MNSLITKFKMEIGMDSVECSMTSIIEKNEGKLSLCTIGLMGRSVIVFIDTPMEPEQKIEDIIEEFDIKYKVEKALTNEAMKLIMGE